jgi:hypothetical protein
MVTATADLHQMHLGGIFALFAAILAALGRWTATGFPMTLLILLFICHNRNLLFPDSILFL